MENKENPQESRFIRKSKKVIERLREKDLQMDFNHLFILECFYYPEDEEFLKLFTIPSIRDFNLSSAYQYLKKEEYIVEDPNDISKIIISVKGKNLMQDLKSPEPITINEVTYQMKIIDVSKTPDECFEEWWKAYPSSPAW